MRRRVLPLVLAAVLCSGSCGLSLQNSGLGTRYGGKRITAVFADVGRLPLGGVVRSGQAEVGRVRSVTAEDFRAVVQLDLDPGFPVPGGTAARLELSSPLGEQFVLLEPPPRPAGPALADGAVIPIERTATGPDVESTLAALGALLNGSGLDQARTVVTELNTAIGGREQQIRELLHQLDSVLGSLDRHRAEINSVLGSMRAVSSELARNEPVLDSALTRVRPALDVLLAEREQFTRLLGNTASLSGRADDLARRTDGELTEQVHQLRPVLEDLREFDGGLGGTLGSLRRFSGLFQQAAPGDYVLFNGTVDVPGSIGEVLAPHAIAPDPPQGPVDRLREGGAR